MKSFRIEKYWKTTLLILGLHGGLYAQYSHEDSVRLKLYKMGFRQKMIEEIITYDKVTNNLGKELSPAEIDPMMDRGATPKIMKQVPIDAGNNTQPQFSHAGPADVCSNLDFEYGNLNHWDATQGLHANFQEYAMIPDPDLAGNLSERHKVFFAGSGDDLYGNFPKVKPGSMYSVRIGNAFVGSETDKLSTTFTVTEENKYYTYHFAVVLENPNHVMQHQPRFRARAFDASNALINCSQFDVVSSGNIQGFNRMSDGLMAKPWSSMVMDLSAYVGQDVTVEFQVYDCTLGGHFGYAYIDGECLSAGIKYQDKHPCSHVFEFFSPALNNRSGETVTWNFGDGNTSTDLAPVHTYDNIGTYEVTLDITYNNSILTTETETITYEREIVIVTGGSSGGGSTGGEGNTGGSDGIGGLSGNEGDDTEVEQTTVIHTGQYETITYTVTKYVMREEPCSMQVKTTVDITECGEKSCENCIPSFSPTPGKYIVSAWVKEKGGTPYTKTYTQSDLTVSFVNDPATATFVPSGQIIDGWQRIEGEVVVSTAASKILLTFNTNDSEAYFDDIRFFPYDGSMLSYVYDPITMRMMAELDDRNYATLYEYDEEGKLIRVKKETERGVMTIKENRDNLNKK